MACFLNPRIYVFLTSRKCSSTACLNLALPSFSFFWSSENLHWTYIRPHSNGCTSWRFLHIFHQCILFRQLDDISQLYLPFYQFLINLKITKSYFYSFLSIKLFEIWIWVYFGLPTLYSQCPVIVPWHQSELKTTKGQESQKRN